MTERQLVTVFIGRCDSLTHLGLHSALASDGRICVLASNPTDMDVEKVVNRETPSVVIIGDEAEHSLLARLRARHLPPAVLVLMRDQSELSRTTLIEAGALCLTYSVSVEHLTATVLRAADERQMSLSQGNDSVPQGLRAKIHLLTKRQLEVLALLSQGASYAEIATGLHISESTAKTHFAQIKRTLGVTNKRDLIGVVEPGRRVIRNG